MKLSNLFTLAVVGLAGSVAAKKCSKRGGKGHGGKYGCLKNSDVEELSAAYAGLIGEFTVENAEKYLTDDWVDISQAINTFLNKNPASATEVTFTKEAFMAAQQRQPGTPVTVLSVPVVDCTTFALIWSSTFAAGPGIEPRAVRGITVVSTEKVDGSWMMNQWDVEFNSLSWNFNLGGSYCLPVPPQPIIVGDATCTAPGAATSTA